MCESFCQLHNFDIAVSQVLRSLRREMDRSTEESGHTHISDGNVPMVLGTQNNYNTNMKDH